MADCSKFEELGDRLADAVQLRLELEELFEDLKTTVECLAYTNESLTKELEELKSDFQLLELAYKDCQNKLACALAKLNKVEPISIWEWICWKVRSNMGQI